MENIEEYIKRTQAERQSHIDLQDRCIERNGGESFYYKGLLAHYLDTTIPRGRRRGAIQLCHACHNSKCGNPKHLYWGTMSENSIDARQNGKKTIWEYMVDKYGEEGAREMQRRGNNHYKNMGKKDEVDQKQKNTRKKFQSL